MLRSWSRTSRGTRTVSTILSAKFLAARICSTARFRIPSLSFLWFDSAKGIAVRLFCPQQSGGTGFSIDHKEDR
jgi:hypothetical protein